MSVSSLIHTGFEVQARRTPGAPALVADGGVISYGELDHASRRLACAILGRSPEPGVVAILATRGPRLVVAMLACARAGRPFVVLDLAYPLSRLQALVDICRPGLALTAGDGALETAERLGLPALGADAAAEDEAGWTAPPISPDAAAYLLFTSGSTGTPRCVAVSHHPLVNFLAWQARTFTLTAADRFTLLSGLSHDPVLRDVFAPLSLGAALHIPAQDVLTAPGALADWFERARPTIAHMTPPLGQLLTAGRALRPRFGELRHVFFGGDVLRRDLVQTLAAVAPACEAVNVYGSTETPQVAAFHRAAPDMAGERAPIGVGIDGFAVEVVDEAGRPAADGAPGEIVVRSPFLTLGFVHDGALPPPRPPVESAYATGDIGVRGADGIVTIQGRRDDQVKIRGHRVELAEVTAAALKARRVGQAIALDVGGPEGARIACFVSPAAGRRPIDAQALAAHFEAVLPAYMRPERVVVLDALPLLPNGKFDRQGLIASLAPRTAAPTAAPASPAEAAIVEEWRRLFRRDDVAPTDSFASLGGDSLSYVGAYLFLEETLGAAPEGWTTLSVAELAALASPKRAGGRGWLQEVETGMVLRAAAISAVVASHFQLVVTGGAAVSALIWVSGVLFGGLQLRQADERRSAAPILRLLASVLAPLAVIEAPQILVKYLTHYHAHASSLLLYTDLLDYSRWPASGPDAYGGHEFLKWYVHALIHILMIYAVLIFVFARGLKLKRPVLAAGLAAVGLGFVGRFVLPTLFVPGFWRGEMNPLSFFNHAPTTHLATFALAALSGLLAGRARLALFVATLGYAALSGPGYTWPDAVAIAAVAGLLAFAPRLTLPRFAVLPVYLVAGACLFIYLLHFKVLAVATRLHLPALVAWPLALAAGVAAWRAWNFALRLAPALRTATARATDRCAAVLRAWTALRNPLGGPARAGS
ncbi:MAG TPA: amino acid adenylation domain-containing protein [Caulobacteraceae bacterium]|nr:amino acid adenylation domain-containing protein [Caulobacteraceae bacterium]